MMNLLPDWYPVTSDEISLLINNIQKKYKTSSIIITHDIDCARTNANRVIMIYDGEIYLEGNLICLISQ